jgi:hypothetical protein
MADEDLPRPRDRELEPLFGGLIDEDVEGEADAEPEEEFVDVPEPLPPPLPVSRGTEWGTACGAFFWLLLLIGIGSLVYLFIGD